MTSENEGKPATTGEMQGGSSEHDPLLSSATRTRRVLRAPCGGGREGRYFFLGTETATVGLAPYWWVFHSRGILIIIFGLFCLLFPELTLVILTLVYGYFMIIDGMICLLKVFGFLRGNRIDVHRGHTLPLIYFANAFCDLYIGIFSLVHPNVTTVTLLLLVAIWFLVAGVMEIAAACIIRRDLSEDASEWFLGIGGILSILFGVLMLSNLAIGALAFLKFIGVVAIIEGVQFLYVGTKLKSLNSMLNMSSEEESGIPVIVA